MYRPQRRNIHSSSLRARLVLGLCLQEDGEERPPSRLRLQLEYDAFELPEE